MFQYKKIIISMLSLVFIFSNTVFAANWIYLQRQEGTRYGPCTEYFDADSMVKEKEKIIVWLLWVLDDAQLSNGTKKILFKQEIVLDQPMKQGKTAMYTYDENDQALKSYPALSPGYYEVRPNSKEENGIEKLLLYAQDGKDWNFLRPHYITAPGRVWHKVGNFSDGEIYLDLTSFFVWPPHSSDKIEVIAKLVWNEGGLEKRKAELAELSKKKYPLAYEDVSYTLFSYQFLGEKNKSRIFEVTDYNDADDRITSLDGSEWGDIEKDLRGKAVLEAILKDL